MASIQEYLDLIKNAIYGKDVRQAIHDGIQQCYYDGKAGSTDLEARQRLDSAEGSINSLGSRMSTAEGDIVDLDARVDQIVAPSGEAPSAAEVADGRIVDGVTYNLIGDAIRAVNANLKSAISEYLVTKPNVLASSAQSTTYRGITYTRNGNKITANGTASGNSVFYLSGTSWVSPEDLNIKRGLEYTLTGCPSGGSENTYRLELNPAVGTPYQDFGNGVKFKINEDDTDTYVFRIYIKSGATVNNIEFEPRCASVTPLINTIEDNTNIDVIEKKTDDTIIEEVKNIPLTFALASGYYDKNGTFTTYSDIYTAEADVDPTHTYLLDYKAFYGVSETVWYDSSDNIIRCDTRHEDGNEYTDVVVTPPSSAVKLMIQGLGNSASAVYGNTSLREITGDYVVDGSKVVGLSRVLAGKKIAYDGDSICESRFTGTTANGGAFAYMISQLTGGTYDNQAVGGGILASAVPSGEMPHSVVANFENLPDDADLYCFEGGINDFWRDVPLGDYVVDDFTSAVDTTTVCGALEWIFRAVTYYHTDKPVCFVFMHRPTGTKTANNASTPYTYQQMREKMIAICKKYAIPFYDAYSESGLCGYNNAQNAMYLTAGQTQPYDGIHPNAMAYKHFYVPQLIALFESIMPID